MKVVFSSRCLNYQVAGHPESPERVRLIYQSLKKAGHEFVKPVSVAREDLLLVHDRHLVDKVKTNSFVDRDAPNIDHIWGQALLAVGGAVKAGQIALQEGSTFSLLRPPGHHAGKNSVGGFCYFNNLAVAVAKLVNQGKRVAILDLDVHHGNGTQEIFLGKEQVLFCSLHQVPLYPGTGLKSEKNCFNFPLDLGTDIKKYLQVLDKAFTKIKAFKPQVLAVSLGFDTFKGDPLAGINLEIEDYSQLGERINSLNLPTFFVLEGGYSNEIGNCAVAFFS